MSIAFPGFSCFNTDKLICHDALFTLTHLRTTEAFIETLDEVGYNNPASVIRQDALFREYYFRADDTYTRVWAMTP